MKTLVIDRYNWQTGDEKISALLNTSTEKMCCLGFYSLSCGIDREQIENVGSPAWLNARQLPSEMNWLIGEDFGSSTYISSDIAYKLMALNDKPLQLGFLQKDREEQISQIFADHDVKVEYIN